MFHFCLSQDRSFLRQTFPTWLPEIFPCVRHLCTGMQPSLSPLLLGTSVTWGPGKPSVLFRLVLCSSYQVAKAGSALQWNLVLSPNLVLPFNISIAMFLKLIYFVLPQIFCGWGSYQDLLPLLVPTFWQEKKHNDISMKCKIFEDLYAHICFSKWIWVIHVQNVMYTCFKVRY